MIQSEVSSRYADAARMFGSANELTVPDLTEGAAGRTAFAGDDPVFQCLCIVLLFCIALLFHYRYELRVLLSGVGRGFSDEFEPGRKMSALSNGFFNASTIAGVLSVTVVAARCSSLWMPESLLVEPQWTTPVAAVFVAVAFAAVVLYERVVLWMVGFVAGNRDFVELLGCVKRAYFAVVSLFLSPVVLLSAMSPESGSGWLWVIVAECLILSFLFLKETFVLFIRKKIPIFQWFLYLCTVEAFPFTLICASIARLR